jgi:hypothetical protein
VAVVPTVAKPRDIVIDILWAGSTGQALMPVAPDKPTVRGKSYSSPAGDGYKPSPAWFTRGESLGRNPSTDSRPRFFRFLSNFFMVFLGFQFSSIFRLFDFFLFFVFIF